MTYTKLPITKIQVSDANPRKAFDEDSILGLAQSIKTDGLLQNLIVGKAKGKKKLHPIICGERRFRAISHLVENGDFPKNYEVTVEIKDDLDADTALRIATMENIHRQDLTPLEEAQALTKLVQDGEKLDDIVAQTGLSAHTVRRRLVLMQLSETVKECLETGEITLSQAEALSVGTFEEQERCLNMAKSGYWDAEDIKDRILGDLPTLSMAIFERELYTGEYTTDLLGEDDNTYFNDAEQFFELQKQAAEELAESYREKADWVEFVESYFSAWQYGRAEEGETGGVIVSLSASGAVEVHEGLIKTKADEGTANSLKVKPKATYPTPLRRYMAMHKSIAVQSALIENPRVAKQLAVANKLYRFKNHDCLSYFEQEETTSPALAIINEQAKALLAHFGHDSEDATWRDLGYLFNYDLEDAYKAVKDLSDDVLESLLVTLDALEFGQLFCDQLDTYEGSIFNQVAQDLRVDMRNYWRPDEAFLKRRNKVQLQQIVTEAGCFQKFGNVAGYKKKELVTSMSKHFQHVLTLESPSEDELKATFWIPEAMAFPAIDPDVKQVEQDETLDDTAEDFKEAA
ncbi:MAG: hypothetical protein CBB87_00060 [Micavibrio sp. TMED27]|nr:hypothetical protein [Micavibrio sp.]OUT93210.1 MAG: hypothetical protein CBB87_00060 [Micavibrio sp. TMED27]|tara:strand:+ start:319 stop:2040 length:1722 start_codon:yes stop_codon:yes gene_type:complete